MPAMDDNLMPKPRTRAELEWFVLFSIAVAGKSAKQTEQKLIGFLNWNRFGEESPFIVVQGLSNQGQLRKALELFRFGQYTRIAKAWAKAVTLDVYNDLTVEKLETIPGIGPKTARFIVLYTNPEAECVPLDTHILKYLAKRHPEVKVPKSTPSAGPKYKMLEALFQADAKKQKKTVRQLDTEVWQSYALVPKKKV